MGIDSYVSWACLGISWSLTLCSEWLCGLDGFHHHLTFTAGFLSGPLCGLSLVERQGHDGSQMLPGSWEQDIQPVVPDSWLVRSQGKPRFKGMEKVTWQQSLHTNIVYQCGYSVNYHPLGYILDMVSIPRFPVLRDRFNYVIVVRNEGLYKVKNIWIFFILWKSTF